GAATEVEQKVKQKKAEDALNATRAAIEEGILPGGGVALLRAIPELDKLQLKGDEQTGVNILKKALETPLKQIAQNAGMDGAVVLEEVRRRGGNFGFNTQTMKYEDLIASGIVDPAKVVRVSLENSASAAGTLLITEAVVADIPEEKKDKVPPVPPEY
ncbi:MAG TPA: molecular chaperone GroEL, partial [bacterium]|nr:molecular chaperone GroEL [bacterium]